MTPEMRAEKSAKNKAKKERRKLRDAGFVVVINPTPPLEKPIKEKILMGCGCLIDVLAMEKQRCHGCHKRFKAERRLTGAERAVEKYEAKEAKKNGGRHNPKYRLPHGSIFLCSYDSEKVLWTGTLTTDLGSFAAEHMSLFRVETMLDSMYREVEHAEYLKRKEAEDKLNPTVETPIQEIAAELPKETNNEN